MKSYLLMMLIAAIAGMSHLKFESTSRKKKT
jgi:hypothetical protein